jgi:hypothetical protein
LGTWVSIGLDQGAQGGAHYSFKRGGLMKSICKNKWGSIFRKFKKYLITCYELGTMKIIRK